MRCAKSRPITIAILLAGFPVLFVLGCQMFHSLVGYSQPWFSHRFHVKEKKLECEDCHADFKTSPQAGMPALDTCQPCHAEPDQKKPDLQRAGAFYPGGQPAWTNARRLSEEVVFSHQVHSEKGVACGECHTGIEESDRVSPHRPMTMQGCIDCHARKGASEDCAACHKKIRKDSPPEDHRLSWLVFHGQKARSGHDERQLCRLCHSDDDCARCHNETKPRDHTNFWRVRGHGALADMDRDRCRTCHQVDYCDRCHSETAPQSHVGSWGDPRDRHCLSCHFPLRAENRCSICHKGTPSHALAAPKPSWHTAAMNCRQCHGVGQPLPHFDNGSNCNVCHM